MLPIDSLFIMQNGIRDADQIVKMIEFVKSGGIFNETTLRANNNRQSSVTPPLVKITRFEDGLLAVHDGFHRTFSVWYAGRQFLLPEEYQIEDWTYAAYLEINFRNGWYTPFDPRTEVRLPDFGNFKKQVRKILDTGEMDMLNLIMPDQLCEEKATKFIIEHPELYKMTRKIWKINEVQYIPE